MSLSCVAPCKSSELRGCHRERARAKEKIIQTDFDEGERVSHPCVQRINVLRETIYRANLKMILQMLTDAWERHDWGYSCTM